MDFGAALHAMRNGERVRRADWKDQGYYLHIERGTMRTSNGTVCNVIAMNGILATDWEIVCEAPRPEPYELQPR